VKGRLVGREQRIYQRTECGKLFGRGSAVFIAALHRGIVGVGSDSIFPIRAAVAGDGRNVASELRSNALERVMEPGVFNVWISVCAVPLRGQRGLGGKQIGVFNL